MSARRALDALQFQFTLPSPVAASLSIHVYLRYFYFSQHHSNVGGTSNATKSTGGGTTAPPTEADSAHRNDLTGNGPEPSLVCAHVLCGHDSPVTSISYATDLDIVLSGSQSGLLCLHSVRKGSFIRSITHILGAPVDLVLATSPGYLIAHSWTNQNMHVFWINGQHRATVRTATR